LRARVRQSGRGTEADSHEARQVNRPSELNLIGRERTGSAGSGWSMKIVTDHEGRPSGQGDQARSAHRWVDGCHIAAFLVRFEWGSGMNSTLNKTGTRDNKV
jgi:hypothetical protein